MSPILNTFQNIIGNQQAISSYLLPNLKDQILQMIQRMLNLIKQLIYYAIIKTIVIAITMIINPKFGMECC